MIRSGGRMQRWAWVVSLGFPFLLNAGSPDGFGPLRPISEAPPEIQQASKAVVRLETAGGTGTGFLVGPNRLITNAHVIGATNCSLEGCFFTVFCDYQHGSRFQRQEVFGVPRYSDVHSDVTVLDLFLPSEEDPKAKPYAAPATLKFSSDRPARTDFIYSIGHSYGGLKRWSTSDIRRKNGDWCETGHCVAPGGSGSPVLNGRGEIVGIVHRGGDIGSESTNLDFVRHKSKFSVVDVFEPIFDEAGLKKGHPSLQSFLSIPLGGQTLAESSADEGSLEVELLLNRKLSQIFVDLEGEREKLVLEDLFLFSCREEVEDPALGEDPDHPYDACGLAVEFIDCTGEKIAGSFCPKGKRRAEWKRLLREVAELRQMKNGEDDLDWLLDAEMRFESSEREANRKGRERLLEELPKRDLSPIEQMPYFFRTANRADELSVGQTDYRRLLSDYHALSGYESYAEEISQAIQIALDRKLLASDEVSRLVKKVVSDPRFPVELRSEIEADYYESVTH